MAFDSLAFLAAMALFGAALAAWFLSGTFAAWPRHYLRFAAVLMAALAAASTLSLSSLASLLLLPLASAALALSAAARFARPLGSVGETLVLVAALAAGLCALLFDMKIAALVPVAVAGLAIMALAVHAMVFAAALSGFALLAASLVCLQDGAPAGMLLFVAAALFGLARNQLVRSTSRERRGAATP